MTNSGQSLTLPQRGKDDRLTSMTSLNIIQILLSIVLIATILVQVRGQGTGLFGSAEGSFRTRRGVEKTLFQFTIVLIVVFILVSILSASPRLLGIFNIS